MYGTVHRASMIPLIPYRLPGVGKGL